VHVATEAVDDGPILAQEAVEVRPDDTVDTLHERIKEVERRLYVDTVLDVVANGGVRTGGESGSEDEQ
jgi:phosphoribosylglycinamide formyltransferase-1